MFLLVGCGLSQHLLWSMSVQLIDFYLFESLYDSCLFAEHIFSTAMCVRWQLWFLCHTVLLAHRAVA